MRVSGGVVWGRREWQAQLRLACFRKVEEAGVSEVEFTRKSNRRDQRGDGRPVPEGPCRPL